MQADFKLPGDWYTDPLYFRGEQAALFEQGWYCVGPSMMVHDGGYRVPKHLPFPVVITRENGKLRAFDNVCLHHKAEVASGINTRTNKLTCKYHGWTYGLDGKLRGTPHLKERPPCLAKGLSEISVTEVGPLLFVNRDLQYRDLRRAAPVGIPNCDFNWGNMMGVEAREYTMGCNWKIYIENYLDGGYHVPTIHKALTGQLDLSSYRIEVEDGYVVQSVEGDGTGDFQERIGERALYVWKYPNLMINRYGPWLTVVSVIPLAPDRTKVKVYYFLENDVWGDNIAPCTSYHKFVEDSIKSSIQVTAEDIKICESVQRGMSAVEFSGIYVPKFEKGQQYFHERLKKDVHRPEEKEWSY